MKTTLSKDHYDKIISKVDDALKEKDVAIIFCSEVKGDIPEETFYDAFIEAAKLYHCPFSFTRETSQGFTNIVLSIEFRKSKE